MHQDLELAATIEANDAQMDALHRRSFQMILDPANELSRQQVVDAVRRLFLGLRRGSRRPGRQNAPAGADVGNPAAGRRAAYGLKPGQL